MRTLLANKDKHYTNYAGAVAKLYKQLRYGMSTAKPTLELDLAFIRKELVDWQANEDGGALSTASINYRTWLAVEYDDMFYSKGGPGYFNGSHPLTGERLGLSYQYSGTNGQNVIEVNAGGALTRINLNPAITINQNSSFIFSQPTPALEWDITHNLGLVPNIFMEDDNGVDIVGTIQVINNNRLKVLFNQPVSGKAFLS